MRTEILGCCATVAAILILPFPPSVLGAPCGPTVPPDFDLDCDVDNADFIAFDSCASGPGVPVDVSCVAKDLDGDSDVDGDDFGILQRCWAGEGIPPRASCAQWPIDVALAGSCTGGDPPVAEVTPGSDLHKVTLHNAVAICNDGSPAIMYIRRASTPANLNSWVFHLQGGGSCRNYEECRDRWCGFDNYSAGKMSTNWAPNSMRGEGIFNRAQTNLANANLVFFYYCSSDTWTGRKTHSTLGSNDNPSQGYTLHFRGHSILEVAVNLLLSSSVTSDDGQETVPPLSQATQVLWTGTSAGASGAEHNLDWFASFFNPAQTQVHGAFNAGFGPLGEEFPPPSDPNAPTMAELIDADLQSEYSMFGPDGTNAFLDQSCMATLGGTAEEFRCANTTYVVLNHLTTPFFHEADLRDSVSIDRFLAYGATVAEFAQAVRATLLRLPSIGTTAVEAASINFIPGVFGPNCNHHVYFEQNAWYFNATVADDNGVPHNVDQALREWLQTGHVLIVDQHPPQSSNCP